MCLASAIWHLFWFEIGPLKSYINYEWIGWALGPDTPDGPDGPLRLEDGVRNARTIRMGITLTEQAAAAVRSAMDGNGLSPDTAYLRVGVTTGGCSGLNYAMGFADAREVADHEFASNGIRLLCDPEGFAHLDGTEIDYHDGLNERGFVFRNPNAQGSCGCGKSFCA